MTDYAPNLKVGERTPYVSRERGVLYDANGLKAGDFVKIVGYDDTTPKVQLQTAATKARFQLQHDGDKGQYKMATAAGEIKAVAGGAIPIDSDISVNANKVIALAGAIPKVGYAMASAALADGDKARVYFDGGYA